MVEIPEPVCPYCNKETKFKPLMFSADTLGIVEMFCQCPYCNKLILFRIYLKADRLVVEILKKEESKHE